MLWLDLFRFRHGDLKDAILEHPLDLILLDYGREAEGTLERPTSSSLPFSTSFLLALAAEVFKLGVNDIAFRRTL